MSTLPPHLTSRLALLSDEADGVAEVALSALPTEDLRILIEHDIIAPTDLASDEPEALILSAHGRQIIAACGLESQCR